MKTTVSAIAILAAMTVGAHAACEVKHGTTANVLSNHATLSHLETDCASAADLGTLQGTVTTQGGDIAALQGTVGTQGLAITALQSENATQQGQIDDHEARLDANATKNGEQDTAIAAEKTRNDTQDGQIADHETRITANKNKNDEQDSTLATHTTQIAGVQAHNVIQDNRLGSLETVTAGHEVRLDAHDALLSQHASTLASHGNRLDKLEKGVAMSMAMPDLYLTEKERFSIAGNIGGFNDEIGFAAGAAMRLDQTWSLNAGVATDSEFKEFGWKAGARAGW
jgi:chromosome segregation ATPase